MTMEQLLDALGAATGPDRGLDKEIHWQVKPAAWRSHDGEQWADEEAGRWSPVPAYTASLDAAASLVPSGCDWVVSSDAYAGADLPDTPVDGESLPDPPTQFPYGATPALSLCIAALKARMALAEAGAA